MDDLKNVELQVGLLEKDVEQTTKLLEKISESLDKMSEISINLSRMITLHEQKHEQHEKVEAYLKEDIKDLHSRITTVTREIHDKIEHIEKHISSKIDTLRNELFRNGSGNKNFIKEIDRYKWMIVGGALTLGWLIGNVNLSALGNLFK